MQVDRQTEVGKTDVQIYLQTNGIKDLQTDTDKQTDRRTVQKYWYRVKTDRWTERPIIRYIPTVLYIRQTYRQTDRQAGQKRMTTDQHTDRQPVYECCVKKSGQNQQY
jgi:hypothetical protein